MSKLSAVTNISSLQYHRSFIGKTVRVLVEKEENGELSGLSDRYVRVVFKGPESLVNTFVFVRVSEATQEYISGLIS